MNHTKLAIIGSGPSGYTAALYSARARLEPVLFAGYSAGGQLMYTTEIENYPGLAEGKKGPELMMEMRAQAKRFGTTFVNEYVTAVDFSQRPFKLWTNPAGETEPEQTLTRSTPEEAKLQTEQIKAQPPAYEADAVIISTGAYALHLGVPGEYELLGKGVSTCAVCDAAFFKDKETFVIGGGDSAMEDSLALTKFAKSVTVVHRRGEFRASKIMQERVLNHEKIKVLWNTNLEAIKGTTKVEGVVVKENEVSKELPADGVFLAIGHKPMTTIFAGQVELDDHGFVITRVSPSKLGVEMASQAINEQGLLAFPTMTSVEGVFAAGDVVDLRYKQAVTAAGQGCMAALDAERWLEVR